MCVCACSRSFPRLTVSRLCYTNFGRATVHGRQTFLDLVVDLFKKVWVTIVVFGEWWKSLLNLIYPSRVLSMNQNEATRLTHHSGAAGRGGTGNLVPELQCHQDPGREGVWESSIFNQAICWKCQGVCSSSDLHVFSIVRVRAIFVRLVLGTIDHFGIGRCSLIDIQDTPEWHAKPGWTCYGEGPFVFNLCWSVSGTVQCLGTPTNPLVETKSKQTMVTLMGSHTMVAYGLNLCLICGPKNVKNAKAIRTAMHAWRWSKIGID